MASIRSPSGGGSVEVVKFEHQGRSFYAMELDGEFNRGLAIADAQGNLVHQEYRELDD
jgi:hypothetical protein